MEQRTCSKCGETKDSDGFPPKGRICRACKVRAASEWRKANPERARANHREAARRRRADPKKRRAILDRENARRRAKNPRVGREFTATCYRCSVEFTYTFRQKFRTVCDICRKHDSDWSNFRLTGAQARELRGRGCCDICGTATPGGRFGNWHIDHDHDTGQVRGILCAPCNAAIGLLRDDPAVIQSALSYVHRHKRNGEPSWLKSKIG